jgi:hypothetical protein
MNRAEINRTLGSAGLAQLNDPGLPAQLGSLVRDDKHFALLLGKCEPEQRTVMYEAMAPNLFFKPRPLHEYLIAAHQEAESLQLPVQQPDGTLRAFNVAEIHTAAQNAVDERLLSEHLTVTCSKCTKQATFHGARKADAVELARNAGWVYDEIHYDTPFEICPECPASRFA